MAPFPETRISLILRLANAADVQAWQEFAELYAPIFLSLARRQGLQPADAEDLTQEILFAVAKAIERFVPDPTQARFRTWLSRIARNLIADLHSGNSRRPVAKAITDSWIRERCEPNVGVDLSEEPWIQEEYRKAVFTVASKRVKKRVTHTTWTAFEKTYLQDQEITAIAQELKIPIGTLYVARCRVLKLLREEVVAIESLEQLTPVEPDSLMERPS